MSKSLILYQKNFHISVKIITNQMLLTHCLRIFKDGCHKIQNFLVDFKTRSTIYGSTDNPWPNRVHTQVKNLHTGISYTFPRGWWMNLGKKFSFSSFFLNPDVFVVSSHRKARRRILTEDETGQFVWKQNGQNYFLKQRGNKLVIQTLNIEEEKSRQFIWENKTTSIF